MNEQMDLFSASYEKPSLPKHIRLIELFAGIGSQAKALDILGCDFEHWLTCEWSWQSITAYNAIHMGGNIADTSALSYEEVLEGIRGVSNDYNKPMTELQLERKGEKWARDLLGRMIVNCNLCPDVSRLTGRELNICDKVNNTYILTYSFPCQDLSNAGLMKGMDKGSATRSGLLWQVERILLECKALGSLPQVLLMENVPGVCGQKNAKPWAEWLNALTAMGYTNYVSILNAKDFGIPQNRVRCFMVSILGEYSYDFPKRQTLRYRLRHFVDDKVDDSYYLSWDIVGSFRMFSDSCKAESDQGPLLIGSLNKYGFLQADSVWDSNGVSPTILAHLQGQIGHQVNILVVDELTECFSIRKLTEGECMRLMGFAEGDTKAMRNAGLTKANIYHSSGDTIVTTVLVALLGSLIGMDYDTKISQWAERLRKETSYSIGFDPYGL